MQKKTIIDSLPVAYCIELNKTISIINAREYFIKQCKNFTFYCSDENCLQPNNTRTKITAINYQLKIINKNQRQPYFRLFPKQKHHNQCCWINEFKQNKNTNETKQFYPEREFNINCPDYISKFHPPDYHINNNRKSILNNKQKQINDHENEIKNIVQNYNQGGERKTKSLELLVESFVKLQEDYKKEIITKEKYFATKFQILSSKIEMPYHKYFRRWEKIIDFDFNNKSIHYKHNGVFIAFSNKIINNNGNWTIYINHTQYNKKYIPKLIISLTKELIYKYKKKTNFEHILEKTNEYNIKLYFMNPIFEFNENNNYFIISFPSLYHLVMRHD